MNDPRESAHQIIDEDGVPVVDATANGDGAAGRRSQQGGPGAAYIGGLPAMQIPERFIGRNGKPSVWKMLGWRGVLAIIAVIAVIVTIAIVSAAFLVFAIPVILVIAAAGWVARAVTGKRGGPSGPRANGQIVVVRGRSATR